MAKNVSVTTVTIANGATTSTAYTLPANKRLLGVQMPAAFTGTAITFEQSSDDGTTYQQVYNAGSAYSLSVTASKYHAISAEVFDGCRVIRLVSGSTEAATRTVTLLVGEA